MLTYYLKDGVTLAVAVLGAGLGIINTWHALNQRRVKLKVTPKYAFFQPDGVLQSVRPIGRNGPTDAEMGCIEVVNLSAFPVGLGEMGFTVAGDPRKHARLFIGQPDTVDGKTFFRRLEPRETVTGYFDLKMLRPDIKKAYVVTDCGEVEYGTSPALEEIINR